MSQYDFYEKHLDPTPRICRRSGPFSESLKTVAEALAFCQRNGLDPAEVRLAHNYVMWDVPETPEEVEARVEHAKAQQRRHLEWVRAAHDEYASRGLFDTPRKASR